jgi:thiol-disulfide isomerase/thioredoxin
MENRKTLRINCGRVSVPGAALLLGLSHAALVPAQDSIKTPEGKKFELFQSQQFVTRSYPCETPADVQAAINSARTAVPGESLQDYREGQQERARQLATQHPGDFWIQRNYIDSMTTSVGAVASDELVSEFRQRFDARPDDPETAYLYAYSLLGKNTPKAIEVLTSLTVRSPSFPLPWLSLFNIHAYPAFSDKAKMQTYGEGFLERCPDSRDAVFLASRLNNSPRLVAVARALRERIAGKTGVESLSLYPNLWNLEFKVAAPAELTRVLQRIEKDLKFLNRLPPGNPVVRSALLEGYKLTFNKKARDQLLAQGPQPPSFAPQAYVPVEQEWSTANTAPPVARIWAERDGGSQDSAAEVKETLDKLRAYISRALQSDLYGIARTDQGGKTWTFASLKGKTTLINLWFTSCGPCRAELPYLQKLYDQIKDRSDMQVVTLNVDPNEGVVKPFLDENQYTFPVLLVARSFWDSGEWIIAPSTWILDAGGIIRVEDVGFAGDGEQWLKRTLAQMESVRSNGP